MTYIKKKTKDEHDREDLLIYNPSVHIEVKKLKSVL